MAFAALIVALGVTKLSEATLGVGGIAIGCYIAICARLVQSRRQHAELLHALRALSAEEVLLTRDGLKAVSRGATRNAGSGTKTFGEAIHTEVHAYASR